MTHPTESELKGCPFCGSTKLHIDDNGIEYTVDCYMCSTSGPIGESVNDVSTDDFESVDDAKTFIRSIIGDLAGNYEGIFTTQLTVENQELEDSDGTIIYPHHTLNTIKYDPNGTVTAGGGLLRAWGNPSPIAIYLGSDAVDYRSVLRLCLFLSQRMMYSLDTGSIHAPRLDDTVQTWNLTSDDVYEWKLSGKSLQKFEHDDLFDLVYGDSDVLLSAVKPVNEALGSFSIQAQAETSNIGNIQLLDHLLYQDKTWMVSSVKLDTDDRYILTLYEVV